MKNKIGLIDVDGHTKVKKWGSAFPNLALMKISAWHKLNGDDVEWAKEYDLFSKPYDILYASKVFTFTQDVDFKKYQYDKLVKGGTGYDYTTTLPNYIDQMQPDYTIYDFVDNREAYGFLTRGCPNKCKWCIVPKKEGNVRPYMDIEEIAINGRNKLILMDNNILSTDYGLQQIEKIIKLKLKVDFNQAMDARFVTDDVARLLASVKWYPYPRFGCDTKNQIDHCDNAIKLLRKYGYNGPIFLYTMIHDDFEESISRVNYYRDRLVNGEKLYPHVQPYIDFGVKGYKPYKWQQDMARWSGVISLKKSFPIMDYQPRKGFTFKMYRDIPALRQFHTKEEIKQYLTTNK